MNKILSCLLVLLLNASVVLGQTKNISGVVFGTGGMPLQGVTVSAKGSGAATSTGTDGRFSLTIPSSATTVVFSFVGYETISLPYSSSPYNVVMKPSQKTEEDVVVVAYATQKKISVVGAVTQVSSKELLKTPASNLTNTLAGRLPGLVSQQTSGDPGRDFATIRIRGQISPTNADPLVMVDGVERSFNSIDPNEVESFTILKDASATAVFGIRGANGVILVTTKRGNSNRKPQISFTANVGVQQCTRLPEFANSYEYAYLKNEGYRNDGKSAFYSDTELENYKNHTDPYLYPDVDWLGEFLRKNAFMQQYNVNVSGGGNLVKYFVSASYLSQDGIYKEFKSDVFNNNLNYNRYNFRSNLDFTVTPSSKISVDMSIRNGLRKGPYNGVFSDATSRIFSELLRLPPLMMPITNPDGTYSMPNAARIDGDAGAIGGMHPLAEMKDWGENRIFSNEVDATVQFNKKLDKLVKGLSFNTNFSFSNSYTQTTSRFRPIVSGSNGTIGFFVRYPLLGKNPDGSYIYGPRGTWEDQPLISFAEGNVLNLKRWYFENKLMYSAKSGRHTYTGLLLQNMSRSTNYTWPFSYIGFSARGTYDYDTRYFAEVNAGYNGSENFAKGSRFGFMPSIAIGWVASNEKFLDRVKALDLLKFRFSMGRAGNDVMPSSLRFGYFNFPYSTTGSYAFGLTNNTTVNGISEGRFGTPDLMWEIGDKYNGAVEMKWMKGILGMNLDVFYEKRKKILQLYQSVPTNIGISASNMPTANIGINENKGYEIELTHEYHIGKVKYWLKGNLSYAKNKILYNDEPKPFFPYLARTGTSIGQPFGLTTAGFFKDQAEVDAWYAAGNSTVFPTKTANGKLQPGDFKYVDLNGDKMIDNNDMGPVGKPTLPMNFYGFSFGAEWGNIEFNALFQGAYNSSMFVQMEAAWAFFNGGKALKEHWDYRWTPQTADIARFPRLSASPAGGDYNYVSSDFWYKDASYLRLKQVQVAYSLPNSLLKRSFISSARFFVSGANLHTWTSKDMSYLDPENRQTRGWFYPQQKVYNAGVNLTF